MIKSKNRVSVLYRSSYLIILITAFYIRRLFLMFDKLVEIIVANGSKLSAEEITLDTDFVTDLEFTSLDIVNCISDAEEAFDREIPEEKLENIKTVGDVLDLLK